MKRRKSNLRKARNAILAEAQRLRAAGVNVDDKRLVIGCTGDESVAKALRARKEANAKIQDTQADS